MKEAYIQNICHYPTDLVLDDVVADIVLVVKDLLISNVSNIHHILHERSIHPKHMPLSHRPCAR